MPKTGEKCESGPIMHGFAPNVHIYADEGPVVEPAALGLALDPYRVVLDPGRWR